MDRFAEQINLSDLFSNRKRERIKLGSLTFKNFRNIHGEYSVPLGDNINIIMPSQEQGYEMYDDIIDMIRTLRGDRDFDVFDFSYFHEDKKEMSVGATVRTNDQEFSINRTQQYRGNEYFRSVKGESKKGNVLYHKYTKKEFEELFFKERQDNIRIYPDDMPRLTRFKHTKSFDYLLAIYPQLSVAKLVDDMNELLSKYRIGCQLSASKTLKKIDFKEVYYEEWYKKPHNAELLELAMIIALERQLKSDVIVLTQRAPFKDLTNSDLEKAFVMLMELDGQVILTYNNPYVFEWAWDEPAYIANSINKLIGVNYFNIIEANEKHTDEAEWENVTLKQALRTLVDRWDFTLEKKIALTERVFFEAYKTSKAKRPAMAISFGKDSMAMLYMFIHWYEKMKVQYGEAECKRRFPLPCIVWCDTGVEFPEMYKFAKEQIQWLIDYGFEFQKTKALIPFFKLVDKEGFPMFGKAIREDSHPEIFKKIKDLGIRTCGNRCCEQLKEVPSKMLYEQLGVDLQFIGLLASESNTRKMAWARTGDVYFNIETQSWKCVPVIHFKEEDIWAYIKMYNVPTSPLYSMGYWKKDNTTGEEKFVTYQRTGCWTCSMGILHDGNNIEMLRNTHPKLWEVLMVKKGLAKEIMKYKRGWSEDKWNADSTADIVLKQYLKAKPCHFDTAL